MMAGFIIAAIGCVAVMFDFTGFLLNDDNYEIVREINKSPALTESNTIEENSVTANQQVEGNFDFNNQENSNMQEQPNWDLSNFNTEEPMNAEPMSTEPKKYGTVQGGQQFVEKSPKDFIKYN